MQIKSGKLIFFSPNGTTKKVLDYVLKGLNIFTTNTVDLTSSQIRENCRLKIEQDISIIAVPVYAGKIPCFLRSPLEQIDGSGKPAILLCVYGNINKGIALNQLENICTRNGFLIIAGGEFIGEHSFCTEELQIAKGRPDAKDISAAINFGKAIKNKINLATNVEDLLIKLPKNKLSFAPRLVFKNGERFVTRRPEHNKNNCINCGICVTKCPMNAIHPESLAINENLCIRCFSCVKNCPTRSRKIIFTKKPMVVNYLKINGHTRKEPNIYV